MTLGGLFSKETSKDVGKRCEGNTIVFNIQSLYDEHSSVQRENNVGTLFAMSGSTKDHMPILFHHNDDARDIWMAQEGPTQGIMTGFKDTEPVESVAGKANNDEHQPKLLAGSPLILLSSELPALAQSLLILIIRFSSIRSQKLRHNEPKALVSVDIQVNGRDHAGKNKTLVMLRLRMMGIPPKILSLGKSNAAVGSCLEVGIRQPSPPSPAIVTVLVRTLITCFQKDTDQQSILLVERNQILILLEGGQAAHLPQLNTNPSWLANKTSTVQLVDHSAVSDNDIGYGGIVNLEVVMVEYQEKGTIRTSKHDFENSAVSDPVWCGNSELVVFIQLVVFTWMAVMKPAGKRQSDLILNQLVISKALEDPNWDASNARRDANISTTKKYGHCVPIT
ncbi:hypothetical protein Tco_0870516 [Tanacetum coccineum]